MTQARAGLRETCRAEVEEILARYPERRSALLPLLHLVQREEGYISEAAMREVAEIVGCRPVDVFDVVTFYTVYHRQPVGKYLLEVCRTLSCALLGGRKLTRHLEERLGIQAGETTADGLFTLREVECIGACSNAPAMLINNRIYENLTPEKLDAILEQLRAEASERVAPPEGERQGLP
ncbi:MAG: NADH-quinone oxidoreductase subunit NuoE [Armatimonadetes bacterium]|jgi:NADH-quinone oxidoreductase subunit E|nr:NADH-quinone oxidoreductase subunit NuoE [Armatimonadota bacterium]